LLTVLRKKHFPNSPFVPANTVAGVIDQIDNLTAVLVDPRHDLGELQGPTVSQITAELSKWLAQIAQAGTPAPPLNALAILGCIRSEYDKRPSISRHDAARLMRAFVKMADFTADNDCRLHDLLLTIATGGK